MENQFKDLEEAFHRIKRKFQRQEITREVFIDQMKKLRFKDGEGRFWMIGAQSGKWYYFDGKEWVQSEPPSLKEGKAICVYCGFENKLEADVCARCGGNLEERENFCPKCGARLEDPFQACPRCTSEAEEWRTKKQDRLEEEKRANFVFRALSPVSFLLFLGTGGIFIGIVLGALIGTSNYFSGIANVMPSYFQEIQGKLIGGLVFAGLGGIFGFLIFGLFGFLEAIFFNLISSLVGGIKISLGKMSERRK